MGWPLPDPVTSATPNHPGDSTLVNRFLNAFDHDTDPSDGDAWVYDADAGAWVPGPPVPGGTYEQPVRWVPGLYYKPEPAGGTIGTAAPNNGLIYYVPMFWPAEDIDRLGVEITTAAAGGSINMAILTMTSSGGAGTKLAELPSHLATDSTGGVEGTVSVTGPGDWVWLAFTTDASISVRIIQGGVAGMGDRSLALSTMDASRYRLKGASSDLTIPENVGFSGPSGVAPLVKVRAA